MKHLFKNKKGVTLLEGLIALLLLALVATGTFGVMLSTSRRANQPDIREEMALAVERAMNKLQVYVYPSYSDFNTLPTGVQSGVCGDDSTPLAEGNHTINCMLPPICDLAKSSFSYTVADKSLTDNLKFKIGTFSIGSWSESWAEPYTITFNMICNGYRL